MEWPRSEQALVAEQERLAALAPGRWTLAQGTPGEGRARLGACFVCFARGITGAGAEGDAAWAAAVVGDPGSGHGRPALVARVVRGAAPAPYRPGLLGLREGPLLERAVRALPRAPDVLLVNAAGRDHPRRAGLALHLGAVLAVPTVGVTHRAMRATGAWPMAPERGSRSPLELDGEVVGSWVRTRTGARPVAAHAAWRTDPSTAADVVLAAGGPARTPEPLRRAREAARRARAAAGG